MTPHLIRKVYNRDGSLLEEYEGSSSKVTSEYVAGTMVELMRAVCGGGGTAAAASAGGNPLGGKTGTVNDHTDVWFYRIYADLYNRCLDGKSAQKGKPRIKYDRRPRALPFFNAFMVPFMKGKPIEQFYETPPMPAEIKRESELRKREELETLEEADANSRKSGIVYTPGTKIDPNAPLPSGDTEAGKPESPGAAKPAEPGTEKPPVMKPVEPKVPARNPETPAEKPDGENARAKKVRVKRSLSAEKDGF
jgi:penicillin-binding protein 1A